MAGGGVAAAPNLANELAAAPAQDSAPILHLLLYGRADCHLCDDMIAALAAFGAGSRFTLEIVDVDRDPALVARFDELVPVLTLDGREICHHFLDREKVVALLGEA